MLHGTVHAVRTVKKERGHTCPDLKKDNVEHCPDCLGVEKECGQGCLTSMRIKHQLTTFTHITGMFMFSRCSNTPAVHGRRAVYLLTHFLIHFLIAMHFLSASLYVSKRGAYWDRLCRDVVGRLVVTRVHCGQTVHPRPIVTMEH